MYDEYYKHRKQWVSEVLQFSAKLSDIIRNKYTCGKFYKWLEHEECPLTDRILQTTADDIERTPNKRMYITEPNSVIHWIAKFKDVSMERLQSMKPEAPSIQKPVNIAFNLISHLTDLRSKFITSNPCMNYFVINITFDIPENGCVSYKKVNRPSYIYKSYRQNASDGPHLYTYVQERR
jgi:hypothetical protein